MGAGRYIGRVGGLAVAFGIGTAVLTGYGVASADTASGSDSGSSSQGSSAGGGATDSSASSAQDSTDSGSSQSESAADDAASDDAAAADDAASDDAAADEAAADEAAAAEDEVDFSNETPVDEADSASEDAAVVQSAAVATPVLDAVDDVIDSGDEPTAPPTGSPMDWAAAAVARRELGALGEPITVDPELMFTEGVIYGNVNAGPGDPNLYTYTLTEAPTMGGKVFLGRTNPTDPTKTIQDGSFNYLPFLDEDAPWGAFEDEQFTVMVSELSGLMQLLAKIPLLGGLVEPIVLRLQETRFLGGLLQPIIGYRTFVEFDPDVMELVPEGLPVAYTTKVTSFDGVQISTNWFPSTTLTDPDGQAPTIFEGPGLGANGNINPTSVVGTLGFVPGMSEIRKIPAPGTPFSFSYVSWDPRGEGASGGFLQLDNPFFEGRDVQHIIDYVATLPWTLLNEDPETGDPIPGDPKMGMIGGSYGGGIQWVTAGIDNRVDAIVPAASWNSLNESLYPTADFKTSWALLLGLDLLQAGARINSRIYPAIIEGTLTGAIGESDQAILSSSGPTVLVDAITAPALIIQGTVDGLFPLNQSIINAGILASNLPANQVKMIWACGGHGVCLTQEGTQATEQFTNIAERTITWLVDWVVFGTDIQPTGPVFEWYDQNNVLRTSTKLPSDPTFYGDPFVTLGGGGSLLLQPLCCGGSGPQLEAAEVAGTEGLLASPALAAPARQAINIAIPGPLLPTQMVGAPKLSFSYSGLGTSRHIYAQLIDDATNLVLGNIITAVPVELDGRTHEVEIDLESIAYTSTPGGSLTLQIVGATSVYADATQWGFITVEDVIIELPTVAGAGAEAEAVEEEMVVAV